MTDLSVMQRIRLSAELAKEKEALSGASALARVGIARRITMLIQQLGGQAPKPVEPEPERLKNFGWDAVKLSDYSLDQLKQLREQVEREHLNPRDEKGRYLENGQPTINLYDKKGRKKLEALSWAVTYKLQDKARAEKETPAQVSEAELIDLNLLKQWGDTWKYKHSIEASGFFTANSKADAVERATQAYWKARPEDRLTAEQRFEKANRDELAESQARWKHLSLPELIAMRDKLGGDIESLQRAARREMSDGGRRTAPAVAAEGARQTADTRAKLNRYIEWRQSQEPTAAPEYPLFAPRPLYHGTGLPFTQYETGHRKGGNFDHQGAGFYLTTDQRGYARFFAGASAVKMLTKIEEGSGTEEERILEDGGVVLDVSLSAAARVIDLTGPDAPADLLALVTNITNGNELRQRVVDAGYDGVAFVEPNSPEGWILQPGAITVVLYNPAVANIGGYEEAAKLKKLPWPGREEKTDEPAPTPEVEPEPETSTPAYEVIEHVTGRGKTLRGIVRKDLSYAEAKAIDEYTFKKDGGYFIREKHLESMGVAPAETAPAEPVDPAEAERKRQQAEADRLANEQERAERKKTEQVAKLRQVAASTLARAESEINADRLTNTHRRASMAASIMERAEKDRAIALTINNLADAIEQGKAPHLAGVDSKAAVEALQERLRYARDEAHRDKTHGMSSYEAHKVEKEPYNLAHVAYAKLPEPTMEGGGTSRAKLLELIKGKRGAPKLAEKIRYARLIDWETYKQLCDMVGKKEADAELGWYKVETLARLNRLSRIGITTNQELRAALAEYLQFAEGARAEDPIAKAERAILGQKVGIDFFPTPKAEAERMARLAGIKKGDDVLEPSAGNGNLADAAKALGANVDVIEISSQLRDILTAKGYTVVDYDFDSFTPEKQYDAVIMNPPFSNRRDAAHIMRAFGMLKPGGRLVAIAGEGVFIGQDAKAVQFREWLDQHGADVEQLGANTFMDKKLLATTGANARLIVIHK
ncbi:MULTISPECIES: class I SAM-dependent methyltransferase [Pseudomonas]|uniref:Methyltransferase domain-containing protein n=1 Tax=Pseudomonas lutea TaxID=243924 RepID=A0A9X8QLP1_9PSED|nr:MULTISPECIES: class I SAM-dependent methyltransferase [Pseudomonas]SER35465.1 Methyltransferase domain-containing protein [Pseudomonas lutea]